MFDIQGPLHHSHLASKHLIGDRRHLPGHTQGQLGRSNDPAHCAIIAAGTVGSCRAR